MAILLLLEMFGGVGGADSVGLGSGGGISGGAFIVAVEVMIELGGYGDAW